jgi:hypothetical protein
MRHPAASFGGILAVGCCPGGVDAEPGTPEALAFEDWARRFGAAAAAGYFGERWRQTARLARRTNVAWPEMMRTYLELRPIDGGDDPAADDLMP